jgi:hypothetical protein
VSEIIMGKTKLLMVNLLKNNPTFDL